MLIKINKYIIVTFLALLCACLQKEQKPFAFVQMGDTQLGMGGYEHDIKSFEQAVKQINELKPDFVIICGDLVDNATDSSYVDFLKIKKEFTIPCYLVAGNHDIGKVPNDTTLRYYRKTIGEDYYEFHHKGYSFIVTNSLLWKTDVENESEKHDRWFKETLAKQNKKEYPVVVIGHFPIYNKQIDEEENYFNFPLSKRSPLLKLFVENNVQAYLSGHKHTTIINNYKNIQLVTGETTSKNFDKRPLGFRHWNVSADTVMHYFVPLSLSIDSLIKTDNNKPTEKLK